VTDATCGVIVILVVVPSCLALELDNLPLKWQFWMVGGGAGAGAGMWPGLLLVPLH